MADSIFNGFQLVDPNTQFTEVNMRNYKSATNPTFKLLVEKTIRNEIQQGNWKQGDYGYETYSGKRFRSDSQTELFRGTAYP